MPLSQERKEEYFERLAGLLAEYNKAFIVEVDNVGSSQLQQTRLSLRGTAEIIMGKNTMMRKCIRGYIEENPGSPAEVLIETCRGNVGFVFTNGDLGEVREVLESNTRPAPARVGSVAPIRVVVPKGPTGCDPGQTAFFQTLQISTKITRGQIEMTNDVSGYEESSLFCMSCSYHVEKRTSSHLFRFAFSF
jgi:large subunit ribosomal protein LP0